MIFVVLYLIAIVSANFIVSRLGPSVSVITAGVLIGFIIYARDRLHEQWFHANLKRNMLFLIATGSLLSIPFNAGRIALASFAAFLLSESVDAIVYHRLFARIPMVKINGSNLFSALVDSIAFPALAFGFPLLWGVMLGQFGMKVLGGFVWSVIITGRGNPISTKLLGDYGK